MSFVVKIQNPFCFLIYKLKGLRNFCKIIIPIVFFCLKGAIFSQYFRTDKKHRSPFI